MTPDERRWTEARIAEWSERAASNRRIACTRDGPINRAIGLESVVRRLQARLDAAGPAPLVEIAGPVDVASVSVVDRGDEVDRLRRSIDALSPRPHRHYPDVTIGAGPIAAAVRAQLAERLAALTGESFAPPRDGQSLFERMSAIAAARAATLRVPQPPARDPEPFTAGPQLEMFG